MMKERMDLIIDYPSKIASMLLDNTIDVGLVPVTVIPEMKEYYIISDYCIGCNGEVASVCLFSDVPLKQIEKILLDYQSRTSVELLKILIKEFWKIDVTIEPGSKDYLSNIKGNTAGLIIGDRAFEQRKISTFIYDLASEWRAITGLPFVFAAWISNKKLDNYFIESFNDANRMGLQKIDEFIEANPFSLFDLRSYYTSYINFILDENMQRGMDLFMKKLSVPQKLNNTLIK